jgi:hypothetical protein
MALSKVLRVAEAIRSVGKITYNKPKLTTSGNVAGTVVKVRVVGSTDLSSVEGAIKSAEKRTLSIRDQDDTDSMTDSLGPSDTQVIVDGIKSPTFLTDLLRHTEFAEAAAEKPQPPVEE